MRLTHAPPHAAALHPPVVQGASGLDGVSFPDYQRTAIVPEKAVLYMSKTILACETPVTLVATGALTNVALALTLYPEVGSGLDACGLPVYLHPAMVLCSEMNNNFKGSRVFAGALVGFAPCRLGDPLALPNCFSLTD